MVGAAAAVAAFAGAASAATTVSAANWNIPWRDIHYPFFPECHTVMSGYSGYGTETCKGFYYVNRGNYMFTQDNIHACPAMGALEHITIDYVLNPASGGVTTTRVLAGFEMHW